MLCYTAEVERLEEKINLTQANFEQFNDIFSYLVIDFKVCVIPRDLPETNVESVDIVLVIVEGCDLKCVQVAGIVVHQVRPPQVGITDCDGPTAT